VTTSEYEKVIARLQVLHDRGRVEDAAEDEDGRPTLRRSRKRAPQAAEDASGREGSEEEDEDARPTLRRR